MQQFIKVLKLIAYFLIFALYAHALIEDWRRYLNDDVLRILKTKDHYMFGARTKYLTFLDLNLQVAYFFLMTMAALCDCFAVKIAKLNRICNFLYRTFAYPLGVFVFLTFWGIYSVDRELIWPKRIELIVPIYQNHIRHTLPFLGVLLDNFMSPKQYGTSILKGYIPLQIGIMCYSCWLIIVKYVTNVWAYGILNVLTNAQLFLFYAVLNVLIGLLYLSGKYLNNVLWNNSTKLNAMKNK
jgi:hypothetical protein